MYNAIGVAAESDAVAVNNRTYTVASSLSCPRTKIHPDLPTLLTSKVDTAI